MINLLKKQGPLRSADPELLEAVKAYIDAHFEPDETAGVPVVEEKPHMAFMKLSADDANLAKVSYSASESALEAAPAGAAGSALPKDLDNVLQHMDAGFSETLLKLIDLSGEKDSAVYKRANVDRRLFSKIRSNPAYRPSKATAVAFAIALKLDLEETNDLIGRAGYVLSHSSEADLIAEFFINRKDYDISRVNEVLYACDQPLLGGA